MEAQQIMKLKNGTTEEILRASDGKIIVAFGDGLMFQDMLKLESQFHLEDKISFIIDNDKKKWGRPVYTPSLHKYDVFPVEKLLEFNAERVVVIITSEQFPDMIAQLDAMPGLEELECYVYPIMHSLEHRKFEVPNEGTEYKIPKVIHYCWFGKGEFPEIVSKCMDTWKEKCPDYEIVRWDESNYDVNKVLYTKEAYKVGAYAYVSDYARLDILNQHGGIYLDTDIALIKPLDELRKNSAYIGFLHHGARVDTGLGFGSVANNRLLQEVMSLYKYDGYLVDNGINKNLNAASITNILKHYGLKQDGSYQVIEGMVCYPREYFDPLSYVLGIEQRTEETYSIHYGNMSWSDDGYYSLKNIRKRSKAAKMDILLRLGIGDN